MPALTSTDLVNRALDLLGTQSIQALTDNTTEAKLASRNYDACRRAVLRMHPWNFAIRRVTLDEPDAQAPVHGYVNRFLLPIDFIRIKEFTDIDPDYRIEGRAVVTDEGTLDLVYVYDHVDVDDFDALFFEAFAHYLAWSMCSKLTQSDIVKEELWKAFDRIVKKARHTDSVEDPAVMLDHDRWLRDRNAGANFVRDPGT